LPVDHETLWGTPEEPQTEEDLAAQIAYQKFLEDEEINQALKEAGVDLPK